MATILIVDDRPANREYMVALLGYGGHRLLEAGDGAEALSIARAEPPDLIISDILMPTMDGYEFVRLLRADPELADAKVIFCTAHYQEREARVLAASCGVGQILTKPCEPEAVLQTVDAALGVAQRPMVPPPVEEFDREHLRVLTDKLSEKADQLQATNSRLSALIDLGLDLGGERDLRLLLQSFCNAAREVVCARYVIVGVLNGEGEPLRFFFTSGLEAAAAARLRNINPREGTLAAVLDKRYRCRLHNPSGDPREIGLGLSFPTVHSFLAVPIVSPAQVYGWLCLIDKLSADEFSAEDERLASVLAAQVGRIYENGSLYADLLHRTWELENEVQERTKAERAVLRSEEELRKTNQRLETLIRASPLAVIVVDLDAKVSSWNPAAEAIFGWLEAEVVGRELPFVPPEKREEFRKRFAADLAGEPGLPFETKSVRRDGTAIDVHVSTASLRDLSGQIIGALSLIADISDQKRLEEQFRQSQKMEAIGRLAGGVAHDFNNLLTVINGYSEIAAGMLRPNDPLREFIEQIQKAGERATALTRQLLAFSRKQLLMAQVVNLNALLTDLEKMLRRVIGEDIEMKFAAGDDLWKVKVDPGQLEQVIMNLVVNARDAMPGGGKLIIETKNVGIDPHYALTHPDLRPGDYIMLAVSDTGCGMDETVKARIFEPFFSTKGDRGTGLGLATVYGIVKQSGGGIHVYSEMGIGTTLKIYLPRERESALHGKSAPEAKPTSGNETVLLVEDEQPVRTLTRIILQNFGYSVLEAQNGGEALLICRKHQGSIDLMITDVVMPAMSGRELVEAVSPLQPAMKVLYVSGYTDDAIAHHQIVESGVPFLQKPYAANALAKKVREVLDGRAV